MDEHAFMFGGVEFGEPPEQLPLPLTPLTELWYIIESPWRQRNMFLIKFN